jgi:hypothetical protein
MKKLAVVSIALCIGLSGAALAKGGGAGSHSGMGPSHAATTGGAFGERVSAPGTNSLGTALSTTGIGNGSAQRGPLLGTSPAVDREEERVNKSLASVCRGC